ncbi:uncharacterized protein LOC132559519 [Ylistrum balloti]|uniref:uncharacterized protein LOC132559519 n=1 Tax=Ylistrum balloti TaxID=509963 RepID=UPI002905CFB0|nr:uncharacterized protein LOC132559519 [Ylistrum balloti]
MDSLVVVLLLIGTGYCQNNGDLATIMEWEASQMPDPYTNPKACGRYENKPAYVCDPNNILPAKGADILDWLAEGTYLNDTTCPCSDWRCEANDAGPYGTIINVAVVKKIKRPEGQDPTAENLLNAARQFTYTLTNERWNKGVCNNNVVIMYSAQDETLFTMAGKTSALKLDNDVITEITNHHMRHFKNGRDLTAGLYSLLVDYRNVLRGEYQSWRDFDKAQHPIGGGSVPVASFATFLSLVFALILSFRF